MFKTEKRHTIDVLFVITLFAVFAFSIILLTGEGATVYESIVDDMGVNYNSRTAFSYVINKIHQSDEDGLVTVGKYGEVDSLVISKEIDNITYCTYLYFYDNHIKEVLTRADQEFDPSYGLDIIEADGFTIEAVSDSLIKCEIVPKGSEREVLFVHTRTNR